MIVDDEAFEDGIVLTRAQWVELMDSVRALSAANAKLVEVVALLLNQTLKVAVEQAKTQSVSRDPYDLNDLRKLIEGGE